MLGDLRIQRFECKYLVTEAVAQSVRKCLGPVVVPDQHVKGRPGLCYPIVSLYLDSAGLTLSRETIEGQCDRYKLRVRAYADDADAPVFLEVKRRRDLVVVKQRCPLPRRDALALLGGQLDVAADAAGPGRTARDEFVRLMVLSGARPTTLVRYDREAYVGRFDPEARVTFDRGLRAARTGRAELRMESPDFAVVEGRLVIMELKFNNRCPGWLEAIVKSHGLRRRSYSKYCHALTVPARRDSAASA